MTLYISKAFNSLNDEPPPLLQEGHYDYILISSLPNQIKLASGSQFTIEDIFITFGSNNYAPGQLEVNFLERAVFDDNVSKLTTNYTDPFEAIRSQSGVLNAIGNGSIIFPAGTTILQLTQVILTSYPGYEAFPVRYDKRLNGAIPTGDIAYIYFRKSGVNLPINPTTLITTPAVDILTGTANTKDIFTLSATPAFGKGNADHITNFVSKGKFKDTLAISKSAYGITASKASLSVAKTDNALIKKAASKSLFVYDIRDGGLYFNADGKTAGCGDTGGLFAILDNQAGLTAKNILLI